ncbi:pyruvate synthase subunit beta [Clostridium sp. 'deep sea']|uniref:thiamine pyrophosphate-dependent enzyme n=1 Tax=Clostridium sp. 'deep sea' TaxID=2779445 RepID=UPI0018967952|nr:thiamine pyrophosphate-dependent enzyme [Clostridium sp. 'deep sea']QOR36747.1 pyruvate synthase subunit beta [Clostridium sp. 'deep sea']
MNKKYNARTITNKEQFYGHKACGGCGESLAIRLAMKVLGERTFAALPAGCMSAVSFIYPNMAFTNNAIITPFASTGAVASGMSVGLKALGIKETQTVGFAGDGGTADIGLQALSGAIDRNDDIIYICNDNEAYMNTGIQKSGLTPYGTRTTTSPAGDNLPGSITMKKNMFEIVAAHGIAYAATASVGYLEDFMNKVEKAKNTKGTSYIHVIAPCPTGWGHASDITISLAKLAVDSGLWYLAEYEKGEFSLNRNPKEFASVEDYLKVQGRFKHLKEADIKVIKDYRDAKWQKMRRDWVK